MNSRTALTGAKDAARALEWRLTLLSDSLVKEGETAKAEAVDVAYEWLRKVQLLLTQFEPSERNTDDDSEVLAWTAS